MGRSKNTWRGSYGRPPFECGDMVKPNGNYSYQGWGPVESRVVEAVVYDPDSDRWTLKIPNPLSPLGYSNYTPMNFHMVCPADRDYKENAEMVNYEASKYLAVRVTDQSEDGRLGFDTNLPDGYETTPMRTSKHQVTVDVRDRIQHGEKWLVLQTVAMIEGEEPRPPIRVTEYK